MRFVPLVGVMALIFGLSHIPGQSMPESALFGHDKFWHALAFATLAASALWAWLPRLKRAPRPTLSAILFFCLLYGISDELHQSFIPGRSPSLADIGADFLGAALIIGLCGVHYSKKRAVRS
jgi:VanZ family protein